jgi:hypothetical protein
MGFPFKVWNSGLSTREILSGKDGNFYRSPDENGSWLAPFEIWTTDSAGTARLRVQHSS